MIAENELVYEALRNTIISCEDGIRSAKINMYIVYFALLAFGIVHQRLLFITFFVLIAFQTMINNDRIAVERASAYIRVFFEEKRNDIHWSSLNKDEEHLKLYHTKYKNIGWYIDFAGSSFLSLVSLIIFVVTCVHEHGLKGLSCTTWIEIVIALLLCFFTMYINSRMYVENSRNKGTTNDIHKSIEDFYKKQCEKENSSAI